VWRDIWRNEQLGAPTGRGFRAVTVRSNGFQNIDVFDVNSGVVIGSFEPVDDTGGEVDVEHANAGVTQP
jgi:hypothetical protein